MSAVPVSELDAHRPRGEGEPPCPDVVGCALAYHGQVDLEVACPCCGVVVAPRRWGWRSLPKAGREE